MIKNNYPKWVVSWTMLVIFCLSFIVHFYPVWHKGYSAGLAADNLILARNLNLTGQYKIENEKNVILSSEKISAEGILSNSGNKLTPFIYAQVFNLFGFKKNLSLYLSLILWSLTTILLFLLVLKLFNFQIALIFGLIDIFIPLTSKGALTSGFYEWASLLFVIALLFYLFQKKAGWLNLVLSSLFFGLASLARNAFLLSFLPFLVYEFWKNRSLKRVVVFLLPFVLLWGIYLGLDYLAGQPNRYLAQGDIGYDGHLFPDPYTYHFEKDEYIKNIQNPDGELISFLSKYNYPVSLKEQLKSYFYSFKFYLREVFRLVNLGGFLMVFLLILGGSFLYRKKNPLIKLIFIWGLIWFFSLIILKTSNWDHFLEIRFPLILMIALGVTWLLALIKQLKIEKKFKYLWMIAFLITLVCHLAEANKWSFHEVYETSPMANLLSLVEAVNQVEINQDDVIAVGLYQAAPLALNYYTDKNFVYFSPETIKNLLEQNKLEEVFDYFGVRYLVGYSDELTKELTNQVNKINIIPDSYSF
jgi:MFS family permease